MNLITYIKKRLQDRLLNEQRDAAVIRGEFVFVIIKDYTNIRKCSDDGRVVIYYSRYFAEEQSVWDETVVSVAEYDRMFGRPYRMG